MLSFPLLSVFLFYSPQSKTREDDLLCSSPLPLRPHLSSGMGGGAVLRSKAKGKHAAVASDGWDRSDGSPEEEDLLSDAARPRSRSLVLGEVATFDESGEPAGDLASSVDKSLISSADIPVTHCKENKYNPNDVPLEMKSLETSESDVIGSGRLNAILHSERIVTRAFSLLKEPKVHSAVTSLLADEAVLKAVMMNHEVQEYCSSPQRSRWDSTVADDAPKYSATQPEATSSTFGGFMSSAKCKFSKMTTGFTDLMQNFLHVPLTPAKPMNARMETETAFEDNSYLAGAMAIAVAVIMIVVFKRI